MGLFISILPLELLPPPHCANSERGRNNGNVKFVEIWILDFKLRENYHDTNVKGSYHRIIK